MTADYVSVEYRLQVRFANRQLDSASPFSAGPRLTDAPNGDPSTQAIASLRGYAYQLYASGLTAVTCIHANNGF